MNVLAADIGNSNIVAGFFDGDRLVTSVRMPTQRKWTAQSMLREMTEAMARKGLDPDHLKGAGSVFSSVVPELDGMLTEALARGTGLVPLRAQASLDAGFSTGRYDVSLLGTDRIVDMAAAMAFYGSPIMVCDLGTATTVSVVDRKRRFVGGMIAAGVQLGLDALAERTAQLPQLEAEGTDVLLGEDTIACMRSGSAAACGIMLDGAVERAAEELHEPELRLVVTGGLGRLVLPWIRRPVTYDPDLLLKGLLILYRNNAPDGKVKA